MIRHDGGMMLSLKRVRRIMKADLGLKYKRVKTMNARANFTAAMI